MSPKVGFRLPRMHGQAPLLSELFQWHHFNLKKILLLIPWAFNTMYFDHIVYVKTTSSVLKGTRHNLFQGHSERHGLGSQILVTPNSMVQHGSSSMKLYSFMEKRKSWIKASLKCIVGPSERWFLQDGRGFSIVSGCDLMTFLTFGLVEARGLPSS